MSVMQINIGVFEFVHSKLQTVVNNKTCDENYISCLTFMNFDKLEEFIKNLCLLNSLSYASRYNDFPTDYRDFINFQKFGEISACQLLKYLTAICYNIEIDTIKETKLNHFLTEEVLNSYELLNNSIKHLQSSIINSLEAYKVAKWND